MLGILLVRVGTAFRRIAPLRSRKFSSRRSDRRKHFGKLRRQQKRKIIRLAGVEVFLQINGFGAMKTEDDLLEAVVRYSLEGTGASEGQIDLMIYRFRTQLMRS